MVGCVSLSLLVSFCVELKAREISKHELIHDQQQDIFQNSDLLLNFISNRMRGRSPS